jgi:predicted alpha-1,2-mannosidase
MMKYRNRKLVYSGLVCLVGLSAPLASAATLELTQFVDPFIGTDDGNSPHPVGGGAGGSTVPGAVVPFGGIQISPDTNTASPSGYRHADNVVQDISMTHFNGAGCANNEAINVQPVVGALSSSPGNSWDTYNLTKSAETATAGYYKATLSRNGSSIVTELTATARTGMLRFTYPSTNQATILISASRSATGDRSGSLTINGSEITGQATVGGFCESPNVYTIFYDIRFDQVPTGHGTYQGGTLSPNSGSVNGAQSGAFVTFNTAGNAVVQMKVAVSYVSIANAQQNMNTENAGFAFSTVQANARNAWNTVLNRVQVTGGTTDDLKQFYTALYRVNMNPNISSDVNGQYRGFDNVVHVVPPGHSAVYQNYSGWDIYRSWAALVGLTDPEASDIAESMVLDGQQGGAIPRWSDQNKENFIMNGDPGPIIVSSLFAFGARNFETRSALDLMFNGATNGNSVRGVQPQLNSMHFIENVSESLEMNASDFAIAQFARALGDNAKYDVMIAHSQWWINVFFPVTSYVTKHNANGSWVTPLDPAAEVNFTEGNAAQYTWMVTHNYASLFNLMGGKQTAIQRLDHLFTQVNAGLTLPFFYIGNEPEHNQPWAYNFAGQPWGTQSAVRRVIQGAFNSSSGGLPGNDDLGATSAWFVWASLGLYPVTPGADTLALHGPLFSSAAITMPNGRILQINGAGAGDAAPYVQGVVVNGAATTHTFVTYRDIANGGTLSFTMGTSPNKSWGINAADAPPSFNDGFLPPAPAPDLGRNLALGRPATGSATCAPSESAAMAFDGVLMNNSKWCSLVSPSFLQVDLGSNQTVAAFMIKHAALGGENTGWNTSAFNLQTSTDGVTFTTRVSVTGNQFSRTFHSINPVTARFVRLNVTTPTSVGDPATRIYELEVYGNKPDGVVFFQDADFGGASSGAFAKGDYPILPSDVPNDWMTSMRIPAGWVVDVFADGGFNGPVCTFTADTANVGAACNDIMSSFRIR